MCTFEKNVPNKQHCFHDVYTPPALSSSFLSFFNSSYWCAPGGCRGYHSDGRVFLCMVLFLIWIFFPYSFLSCCYRTYTHSLDWYRDDMMVMIFVFVFPPYISLKCRCLMNKHNLFDGCEKKTKNVKKTKKIQSSHDAMIQQTFLGLCCYSCFHGECEGGSWYTARVWVKTWFI